jgi:hypothetical protein
MKPWMKIGVAAMALAAVSIGPEAGPAEARAGKPDVTFSTRASPMAREPRSFSCQGDRVYAIVLFPAPVPGRHLLKGEWYKPGGIPQERTEVPLVMSRSQRSAYLWLKFELDDNPMKTALGRDGDASFSGEWLLDVFWDGKKMVSRNFRVDCG